jgi:hypothetical protein
MKVALQQSGLNASQPGDFRVQLAEVVTTTAATLAVAYLLINGRWVPGFGASLVVFSCIAALPPTLRWLSQKYPRSMFLDVAASFWLIPAAAFGHIHLGPVVDAFNPRLMDPYLALADLHLFGGHVAVLLDRMTPPWLTEILMICYYTYFVLAFTLGVALFFTGRRRAFDEFVLALSLFYAINYFLYAAVPAIGPRFFLWNQFSQPLKGLVLTPYLDALMRTTPFQRDCFPSGHTASTLLVLAYAFRYYRKLFWILLPFGAGLIAATLVGRFHYAIDLLCAVPVAGAIFGLASALAKARPHGVRIPTEVLIFQEPARI